MKTGDLEPRPGNQCIVALTFDNFGESYDLLRYGHAGGASADGAYAPRRGVRRILDLLDEFGVPATFFVEGWNARKYTSLAREVADRGHEVAAHGWMHEQWDTLDPITEAELIRRAADAIEDAVGERPRGWRSPGGLTTSDTLHLLHDAGYRYDSSFGDEDGPYLLQVSPSSDQRTVELPWRWAIDDAMYYSPSRPITRPSEVAELWKEEFDAALDTTGFFILVCHPRFSGRPAQIIALRSVLEHIRSRTEVRFARCDEIAAYVSGWNDAPSYSAPETISGVTTK